MGCVYFDKDGFFITMEQWSALLDDMNYRRIGLDIVNGYRLSTVWLGLDHSFTDGPETLTFESMIFIGEGRDDRHCDRYGTLQEAQAGHAALLDKLTKGWKP